MFLYAIAAQAAQVPNEVIDKRKNPTEVTNSVTSVDVSAVQLFKIAEKLEANREFDQAIEFLKPLDKDPNAEYRAEARARIARIYIRLNDHRLAARWFQKLLDEKPNAGAIRIELARVLARLGDEDAAGRQLRRAASAPGIPEDVSRALGRIGANIRNNAPFGGSFQLGIAPDSNINRATDAQQVDIFGLPFNLNEDGRAQSGVGLTVNAATFVRQKISSSSRLIAQISVDADLYKRSDFNDINFTVSIGPEILSGKALFRPLAIGGSRWLGNSKLYDFYGLSASVQRALSKTSQITTSGTVFNFDYPTRPDLSGPIYSLGVAYERALSPRLSARLNVAAARIDANAASNASNNIGGDVTVSRDVGRLTLFTKIGYNRIEGDAPFTAFGATRRDNLYDAEAGLVFRQISALGLSPLVRARYTRNQSSLTLFDFERRRFEFALTKTF